MSIFSNLGPVVPSAWSFSSCLSDSEAEAFESTVPDGIFSDDDYGMALVFDEAGLIQRGSMAGYATKDSAMDAIKVIVTGAGMKSADQTKETPCSSRNCKSNTTNISGKSSTSLSDKMLFFSGTAEALHLAMSKLRVAAWLRHHPGFPDVGRCYAVYPRSRRTAKYVPQDSVFNEV